MFLDIEDSGDFAVETIEGRKKVVLDINGRIYVAIGETASLIAMTV